MSLPKFTTTHHSSTYASISPLLPSLSTAGKKILITGGGSGLGPQIAHSFAASGSTSIALLGRTLSTISSVASTLRAEFSGLKVLTYVADIVDATAVNAAFASVVNDFGRIDVVVSNAGYMPDMAMLGTTSIDIWWKGLEVNVRGSLVLAQAFLSHLPATKMGEPVLIHLSTAGAHLPAMPIGISGYAVSKLAAAKMMEYLQAENSALRVMIVHPGVLNSTPMGKKGMEMGVVLPGDDEDLAADFVVWSASEEAGWLRGKFVWSNWDVDELKARKEEILTGGTLTLGLNGWPSV